MAEIPKGYHIEILDSDDSDEEWLRRDDNRQSFRLTDRPFADSINHYLGHLPSQILNLMTGQEGGLSVTVLDMGGGRRSRCAGEIASRYGYKVQVTNLELMPAIVIRPNGVRYIEGNICDMWQIAEGSVDFAYTYQVLPHLEEGITVVRALSEIARVLAPGGVAIIDESEFSQLGPTDIRLLAFAEANDVFLQRRTGNSVEKGKVTFGASAYWHFLMMLKEPVNWTVATIRERLVESI